MVQFRIPCSPVFRLTIHFTGVKDFNVSLDTQTAEITTDESLSYQQVLEKISKTGKKVNSGEADGVAQSVEVTA